MRNAKLEGSVLLALLLMFGSGAADRAVVDAADHSHGDMKHDQTVPQGGHGMPMESLGERIFQGKSGPWNLEARLIDMKAQLEKSGVSAKTIDQLGAKHHLMVLLTDPKTGKPVTDVMGEVIIKGPDKTSSSKVTLVVMGGHIGSDVALPRPGKYAFRVTVVGGGQRGYAVFEYKLKR
jgi:hypothetical protein